jgi:serine/threonine-protein kinase
MSEMPAEIGQYLVERQLGEGGMGAVYLGVHKVLGSRAAIKTISAKSLSSAEAVSRLMDEGRALASLEHPNIVRVLDFLTEGDRHYLIMEYVEGESLDVYLARAKPDLTAALELAIQVGAGVAAAHAQGVLHRDIKPQNVMVTSAGAVKVMDFGLAKFAGAASVTQSGVLMGTPLYMAPEQVLSQPIDARTDQYAFGVLLYRLLCGREPFIDGDSIAICFAHLREPPPPPQNFNPQVPPAVTALVLKVLSKLPEERYPDMNALLGELARLRENLKSAISQQTQALPAPPRAPRPIRPPPPARPAVKPSLYEKLMDPDGGGWKVLLGVAGLVLAVALAVKLTRRGAVIPAAATASPAAAAAAPANTSAAAVPAAAAPGPAAAQPVSASPAFQQCKLGCDEQADRCTQEAQVKTDKCKQESKDNCEKSSKACLDNAQNLQVEGPEGQALIEQRKQNCRQVGQACAMSEMACGMLLQSAGCSTLRTQCYSKC